MLIILKFLFIFLPLINETISEIKLRMLHDAYEDCSTSSTHINQALSLDDEEVNYEIALQQLEERLNFSYNPVTPNLDFYEVKENIKTLSLEEIKEILEETSFPPGENGHPVDLKENLNPKIQTRIDKGWKNHAFNEFVSDIVPLNRSLPDVRHEWCHKQNYTSRLPKATVVICFYNEARSTLMRTVYSVLDRTPNHLLKEIVLFDDFSTLDYVWTLDEDVNKLRKVKLVRASSRLGLIKARMQALDYVTAPVVVFLDSHCECTQGWLEPLLDRIAKDDTKIASPVVDRINEGTFEYHVQDIDDLKVGAFNWDHYLKFIWKPIPKHIQRNHQAEPIETPTISGGLFAVNVKHFRKLGLYDPEYKVWGAENLELSFKIWMCGGSAEIVPCSHVGHVFRSESPYAKEVGEAAQRNMIRMSEVWLDDYKKYYYEMLGNNLMNFGNVSNRIKLRKQLNCQSFKWYLNKFDDYLEYPESYAARGKLVNMFYNMCLSADVHKVEETPVLLQNCHSYGKNQFWVYTSFGKLKRNELCLDYVFGRVTLFFCREQTLSQVWLYDENTNQVKNIDNQKCLRVKIRNKDETQLHLETCSDSQPQKWRLENYNNEKLSSELKNIMKRETF